tara:strand:- start:5125 stop:6474 length:1350 start_codon:yes stop_codon:yes gene_type:complete
MFKNLKKFLFEGHQRTVKAKKHIILSLILKGINIIISLVFVPLILNYLDTERYGIWLTLSSIIAWFAFFDVGLGNGLRNRLAEAIANENKKLAKIYVSTSYAILSIIFGITILIFLTVNPLLNWQQILNTQVVTADELSIVALIVFVFSILRFFFNLIGSILMAYQRPAINSSFSTIGNIISLLIIIYLIKTTEGSLINLAAVLSSVPVLVLIVATLFLFSNKYRYIAPSIDFIDISKARDLVGLGFKFFYFQIAYIIFFSTTNIFIAQFVDQEAVASYNIAYKVLFIPQMIQLIIIAPFWSAVTDAYSRNDYQWIKDTLKNLNFLTLIFIIFLSLLTILSPYIYKLWVGDKVSISFSLSLVISIYFFQGLILGPFSTFINGLGKLRLGIYSITLKLIIFIPLAFYLGDNYGAIGIVASMIISQVPSMILEPLQVYKILNKNAKGIWNL